MKLCSQDRQRQGRFTKSQRTASGPLGFAPADVKNKRGQHSRGKKITGLAFLPSEPGKLLITSNDSRVRQGGASWRWKQC